MGYFEQRLVDAVATPDACFIAGENVDGEVLADLSASEVGASELAALAMVGAHLVDEHHAVLAAVHEPVRLIIAVDVDTPDHPRAVDRGFPDRGPDSLALSFDFSGSAEVVREQASGSHPTW